MTIFRDNIDSDTVHITLIDGVTGLSLYINNFRVAGEKPWGGGELVKEWFVSNKDDMMAALSAPHFPLNPTDYPERPIKRTRKKK